MPLPASPLPLTPYSTIQFHCKQQTLLDMYCVPWCDLVSPIV